MKSTAGPGDLWGGGSHPTRGAWIEIIYEILPEILALCRTPHGVRGLKSLLSRAVAAIPCRTPHGVRGLKYLVNFN